MARHKNRKSRDRKNASTTSISSASKHSRVPKSYIELIKEGLSWITGGRTRAGTSESHLAAGTESPTVFRFKTKKMMAKKKARKGKAKKKVVKKRSGGGGRSAGLKRIPGRAGRSRFRGRITGRAAAGSKKKPSKFSAPREKKVLSGPYQFVDPTCFDENDGPKRRRAHRAHRGRPRNNNRRACMKLDPIVSRNGYNTRSSATRKAPHTMNDITQARPRGRILFASPVGTKDMKGPRYEIGANKSNNAGSAQFSVLAEQPKKVENNEDTSLECMEESVNVPNENLPDASPIPQESVSVIESPSVDSAGADSAGADSTGADSVSGKLDNGDNQIAMKEVSQCSIDACILPRSYRSKLRPIKSVPVTRSSRNSANPEINKLQDKFGKTRSQTRLLKLKNV